MIKYSLPIAHPHDFPHMPSSVIMFWCIFCTVKENRCWFGNPFALSSVCLLGPTQLLYYSTLYWPVVDDWWWCDDLMTGNDGHTHCWWWWWWWPVLLTSVFWVVDDSRAHVHLRWKTTKRAISFTVPGTFCKTDVREYNTLFTLSENYFFIWISLKTIQKIKYPTYRPPFQV